MNHKYNHLFNKSLFELPSSLFVSGNDLCIAQRDQGFYACSCGKSKMSRETQKCPHCGNMALEIKTTLCLMAHLQEASSEHFCQILYFFSFQTNGFKEELMLERIGEISLTLWDESIYYRECNSQKEIISHTYNVLKLDFEIQSNTFQCLQKGFVPLSPFCLGFWNFGMQKRDFKDIRDNFPKHIQFVLEFILLSNKKCLFKCFHNDVTIINIYRAYISYYKHSYLHTLLPMPLLVKNDPNFDMLYNSYTSLEDFVHEGIFQHKASKAIKRWFYNTAKRCYEKNEIFVLDTLLMLVKLFTNKDYLLQALIKLDNSDFLQEIVTEGFNLIDHMGKHYGEKWLLNYALDTRFYPTTTYYIGDMAMFFDVSIKHELLYFPFPKVKSLEELIDAIDVYLNYQDTEPFKYNQFAQSYEREYKKFCFKLPKTPLELLEWGDNQHNCLHNYINSINQEKTIILGIFKENKQRYTIELDYQGRLKEAKGRFNRPLTPKMQTLVETYVEDCLAKNEMLYIGSTSLKAENKQVFL